MRARDGAVGVGAGAAFGVVGLGGGKERGGMDGGDGASGIESDGDLVGGVSWLNVKWRMGVLR